MTTRTKFLGFTFVVVCLALFGWSYFCVGIPGIAEVSLYQQPVRSVVMDNCSGKGITALPSQEIPELVRSTLAAAEPISPEHYQVAGYSLCNSGRRQLRYVLDSVRLTQKFRLRFSAREIQTIYLNESYFGENAVGVQQAASTFIHKDVKDLSLSEGALLVGLLRAPARYSPSKYRDKAKVRRNHVLHLMASQDLISVQEAKRAKAEPLPVS